VLGRVVAPLARRCVCSLFFVSLRAELATVCFQLAELGRKIPTSSHIFSDVGVRALPVLVQYYFGGRGVVLWIRGRFLLSYSPGVWCKLTSILTVYALVKRSSRELVVEYCL